MESNATPAQPKAPRWDVFTAVRACDGLLAWCGRRLNAARFEAVESWTARAGHYAMLVAAGLGLFCGIAGALKWDQLSPFVIGIAWLPCVAVAQFVAAKFVPEVRVRIDATGTRLALPSFLACIAAWSLFLGAVALLGLTFAAIRLDSFTLFGIGIGIFLAYELMLWLCLNPSLLNIAIEPAGSVWEEALGVLAFLLKVNYRLVPMLFGVLAIVGDFCMLAALINLFRGELDSMAEAWRAALLVVGAGVLPLVAYVLFVLHVLCLDFLRAVLSIPGKLDVMARK